MRPSSLRRILVIEDEADIQAVMKLSLESVGGFTVAVCSSGNEALATAPAFAPDLILLDVMMPDMDGPSTLRALRMLSEITLTPVVFVTAKAQPQEVTYFRSLGALDVVAKPFDPLTLPATISAIWSNQYGE
jgi:DNA-binding response OmpR family regulator